MLKIKMDDVESIIREVADQLIVPRFQHLGLGEIKFKGEDDPVTIADKEAEIELTKRLSALLPGSKVVGEENFAADPGILEHFFSESPVWIIDPVDGTKLFMEGKSLYGVIVALAEQNQTIAGWLYDPTSKEFVSAEKGAGAWYKGRRCSVLPPDRLENLYGVIGRRIGDAFDIYCAPSEAPRPHFHRMLSACHEYASLVVREPHFSKKMEPIHFHSMYCTCTPWDNAAGIMIHAEAGGYTAHWNGEPFAPADHGRGVLSAPDKESWEALRDWIASFCKLPEC